VILASRNGHKLREFEEILPYEVLDPLPEGVEMPPETGSTFEENALIKARAAHVATGEEVVADDSGLVVEALGGDPGVKSARYAGDGASDGDNLAKLIGELAAGGGSSPARYVCVIAWIDGEGAERTFEATCEGTVTTECRGEGGFGYDPAFVPDETGPDDDRTMAELSPEEKHAISHRGRAARALASYMSL
jgi:XTP/dITP diphosphohydrolase